jgi:hypothetical protein
MRQINKKPFPLHFAEREKILKARKEYLAFLENNFDKLHNKKRVRNLIKFTKRLIKRLES